MNTHAGSRSPVSEHTDPTPAALLAFLAEISQQLAVSVDLARSLRESVTYVARYLDAEAVSVFLLDEKGEALECRACQGPVDILGLRIPVGQGIVGRSVSDNACQMVRDAYQDPDFVERVDADTGLVTRSVLCAPLTTARGVIGAIQVINKRGGKLFDGEDMTALRVLAAPMALALNTARLTEELVEQHRIQRELSMARRLQRSLLPKRRRGAFPLLAINLAAQEISGDFYDFFDLPDGRIAFTIGDVAGKGLDAAFLMVRCASLLRWAGKEGVRPSDWLARANDELGEAIAPGMFVCAVAGHYDPATREVVWANAGFPPLQRVAADGTVEEFAAEAPPLGILRRLRFPEQTCSLDNANLYLYSDGVTDVRDAQGKALGVEGVAQMLKQYDTLVPEPRLRALVRRLRAMQVTDDITLMLIAGDISDATPALLRYSFPAQPGELAGMRRALASALAHAGVRQAQRQQLILAVDEASTNIIRHGYGGPCNELIHLNLDRDGDDLLFELLSEAPCPDVDAVQPRDLSSMHPGGLGMNFIDCLMDEWGLTACEDGGGTRLLMRKRIEAEKGQS